MSYAGLFEAIKVRKSGFSYRKPYADFLKEYRILCQVADLQAMAAKGHDKDKVGWMLGTMLRASLDQKEWQLGRTKAFMRNGQRLVLSALKDAALTVKTIILQSAFRGVLARRRVKAIRAFSVECAQALSMDDLRGQKERLRALQERAHKAQFHLFICRQIKTTLDYLAEEERTQALLVKAVEPPPQLPLLQSALEAYTALTAKLPSHLPPLAPLTALQATAAGLVQRLQDIDARKRRLRDALVQGDMDGVRGCVEELRGLGVGEEDEEVAAAAAAVKDWESEGEKWSALRAAIGGGDVLAIEGAIEAVRRLPLDAAKTADIAAARDALLRLYGDLLDAAILAHDDEVTVRRQLMPKLEQLQFVDLVLQAQAWLDEQDNLRVIERQRRDVGHHRPTPSPAGRGRGGRRHPCPQRQEARPAGADGAHLRHAAATLRGGCGE